MATTSLVLVRHGETSSNKDARLQGQLDVPLSDIGRAQARALGKALSGIPFDSAYTSDLVRSSETAALCLAGRDIAIVTDARLRERHYGIWQGELWQAIRQPSSSGPLPPTPTAAHAAPPGGESWAQLRSRVARSLSDIVTRHSGRTLLVVAHGGTLRAAFCHLLKLPGRVRLSLRTDNACICRFDVGEKGTDLVRWNDTNHLA